MSVTTRRTRSRAAPSQAVPDEPIYRLSVEQYHAMARAGILDEDAPVELLEGWLVRKMTKYPPHSVVTTLVRQALERLLPEGWYVPSQEPITTRDSEPEPDLMIVRGEPREYLDHHPAPEDVALIIEVADTSLRRDRGTKKRIYARAAVRVYWIVNLIDRQIEVYTEPASTGKRPDYRQRLDYGPEGVIPVVLDEVEVGQLAVGELLP
jgi:Uma2 family endonuclease